MLIVLIMIGWYAESNSHVITLRYQKIVLFRLHLVFNESTVNTLSPSVP